MNRVTVISNLSFSLSSPISASICSTFGTKLRGLMFSPNLAPDKGLVFIEPKDSKINSSIHMLFMNFDISVIWLDQSLEVVDLVLAKKWHPAYFPARPASYTLELHPSRLSEFHLGDKIALKNV